MFKLAQIYDEAKYDVHNLLRLYKIVKDLGMEKQDITKVLDLVKNNQLETLQSKAESLRDEIRMLEIEKMRFTHRIVGYKRVINELQSSLAQKRGMPLMNQESAKYDRD